jgi:hypothetical protein
MNFAQSKAAEEKFGSAVTALPKLNEELAKFLEG